MKLNTLLVALVVAAVVWVGLPKESRGEPREYQVIVTAYTCEPHPANPVHPCGPLRWGGDINSPGMACPVEWRNRLMEVPGFGVRRCDDTPAQGYLRGLPHIDLRVATVAEARLIGIRRMVIRDAAVTEVETEAAEVVSGPELAIKQAKEIAPTGDTETAMVRLLQLDRARHHFPELLDEVGLQGDQHLWVVTLWVPPHRIPQGTVAKPDESAPVAARFFAFDAETNKLVADHFVSMDVLETMGWIPSEDVALVN